MSGLEGIQRSICSVYTKRFLRHVSRKKPVQVVLRFDAEAAPDASAFLFHPDQTIEKHGDGTLTVRFKAGGIGEMCWHLVTWGEHVRGGKNPPVCADDCRRCAQCSRRITLKLKILERQDGRSMCRILPLMRPSVST